MRLFKLLTLLGVMTLWTGCGLPDSFFLVPPSVGVQASPGTPIFQITGTDRGSDTGATFQGYELYYKFYGNDTDSTFTSDANNFTTASTYTDLQQDGFHRLCLAIGTSVSGMAADATAGFASAPVVNIAQIDPGNIGNSYTIVIKLNDLSAPLLFSPTSVAGSLSYYNYLPPGSSVVDGATIYEEVRRFVNLPTGAGCKTFAASSVTSNPAVANNYDTASDADLLAVPGFTTAVGNNGGYIFVMIYAFGYGKSIVDGTPVYSSPVKLGYTKILVSSP